MKRLWLLLAAVPFLIAADGWQWRGNPVRIEGDDGSLADVQESALIIKNSLHYAVHQGLFFTVPVYAPDVDNGDTLFVYLKSPAGTNGLDLNLTFRIDSEFGGSMLFYENPTVTDTTGMTNVIPRNNDRNSSNTTTLKAGWSDSDIATIDVATANLGTLLWSGYVGSGGAPRAVGGEGSTEEEWLPKASEEYLILFISTTNDTHISVNVGFYLE